MVEVPGGGAPVAPNSGEASCRRRAWEGLQEKEERDSSLLASLLMAFGRLGELRLVAGSDGNGGEARARGWCLGSIQIRRGQGCTGWLAGSGCARGLGRWDLEGSRGGRWRRHDRTGSLGFRVGLV